MDVSLKPGGYVVAVSGGVDSVALLHALHSRMRAAASDDGWKLIVAHYDHGIRPDSAADRQFVQKLAGQYGLPFAYDEGDLGVAASEATAREARYGFLRQVRQASGAQAIVTAHHQDDALETAIINMLRGTGRLGLTALATTATIKRPLLRVSKQDIIAYAKKHSLQWREDSTNADQTYLRNYVRHKLLPRFDDAAREQLLRIIATTREINQELDTLLVKYLRAQSVTETLDRQSFNCLPHSVAREVLAAWLRAQDIRGFDRKALERLVVAAKTAQPGAIFDVLHHATLRVNNDNLALAGAER
ncbi:MAG: tRNA lysidine(34) synthetase TilS [Candidatus Saccharimonadales bacterium]